MSFIMRSEDMKYVRIHFSDSSKFAVAFELGKFGKMHCVDLSGGEKAGDTERASEFKKRVAQVVFLEKKLAQFENALEMHSMKLPAKNVPARDTNKLDTVLEIERTLLSLEGQYVRQMLVRAELLKQLQDVILNQHALVLYREFLPFNLPTLGGNGGYGSEGASFAMQDLSDGAALGEFATVPISGVIAQESKQMFEKMLFRLGRGNIVVNFRTITDTLADPDTNTPCDYEAFLLLHVESKDLKAKVQKALTAFKCRTYELPLTAKSFSAHLSNLADKLRIMRSSLEGADKLVHSILESLLVYSPDSKVFDVKESLVDGTVERVPLVDYKYALTKEKLTQDFLRMCKASQSSNILIAEAWVPKRDLNDFHRAMNKADRACSPEQSIVEVIDEYSADYPKKSPPTYIRSNVITRVFQNIVDTYGVPNYKEFNPAIFTIVTFPFLFAVMYGDVGHGGFLLMVGLSLLFFEKTLEKQQKEGTIDGVLEGLFEVRYCLTMMGAFAFYNGFMYNDFMSVPTQLFNSSWTIAHEHDEHMTQKNEVYPFGVDWNWYHKSSSLVFFNSMKMKIGVILGVIQMLLGVFIGLANNLYFKDKLHVVFESFPRFVFLFNTFGYMSFIIVLKWCIDYSDRESLAPNLIQVTIDMFLSPGNINESTYLYAHQETVQFWLVISALIMVPLMLFPIPCIENCKHKAHAKHSAERSDGSDVGHSTEHVVHVPSGGDLHPTPCMFNPHDHGPEFKFSDAMIIQTIHTIEYVLGAVSNTASYLRLWALSLAHAELARVFWDMLLMQYGMATGSWFMTVIGCGAWLLATFVVLCMMDVLECFLHALRLHWVEFQNKFYFASGYMFKPYAYPTFEI